MPRIATPPELMYFKNDPMAQPTAPLWG